MASMSDSLYVHQFRFSNWMPTAIRSISVDPFSGLVAVGRSDGDIEISDPHGKWYTQGRIKGRDDFQLNGLAFSSSAEESGRLFGVSSHGFLFEVDCGSLALSTIRDSYGGSIWSIAASKRRPILGIGCEDGTAKLFSYENGGLEYVKSFPATGSRVLCVCFDPTQPRILLGGGDGSIRCYDEDTGINIYRLAGDSMKGDPSSIWSLCVLSDSTIVSGDTKGQLQFWRGTTGDELLCTITQHTSRIMCICASTNEDKIFASGVDSRVICVNRIQTAAASVKANSNQVKWVYTSAHRPHSHDVYSLAIVPPAHTSAENSEAKGGLLLSGGLDCKLCMYAVDDFVGVRPSWVLPIPARGLTAANSDSSIMALKHRNYVDLWTLCRSALPTEQIDSTGGKEGACRAACRIQLKEDVPERDHIHSVAMTASGDMIAVSGGAADGSEDSTVGLRMWTVRTNGSGENKVLTTARIPLPQDLKEAVGGDVSCQALSFSEDGHSLAVATSEGPNMNILLLDIVKNTTEVAVTLRKKLHHTRSMRKFLQSGDQATAQDKISVMTKLSMAIDSLDFSSGSRWLAVSSCGNRVAVYELDRLALHWVLPAFPSPVSCMAFHPTSENSLLVVSSGDNSFQIFDVMEMDLTPWSKENSDIVPKWSASLQRSAMGAVYNVSFDPSCDASFVLHGQGFSAYINLDGCLPPDDKPSSEAIPLPVVIDNDGQPTLNADVTALPYSRKNMKKRKKIQKMLEENSSGVSSPAKRLRESNSSGRNFSVVKTHRSLVHLALLGSQEMVVVENPWVRILESLPDTLARKRYAT